MAKHTDWQTIKPLDKGGQSEVFLVRTAARATERARCLEEIRLALDTDKRAELAEAIWSYARPDRPSELGALKVFRIPQREPECAEALRRLHNEITVLRQNRLGLAKLLDCSEAEAWIVTEYYQQGTVEKHLARYRGNALSALIAFRSLVDTTASLHKEGTVHRDIKPNNVFVSDDALILGDLGIVFLPVRATA